MVFLRYILVLSWYLCYKVSDAEESKICRKNESFGDREGNVYTCPNADVDSSFTECCEKDQEFTCCEPDSSRNLREQLQLWGTVAGVIVIMIIIGICIRKDFNLCKSERWIFYKYTARAKEEKKKGLVHNEQLPDQREYSPNYNKNSNYVYDGNAPKA